MRNKWLIVALLLAGSAHALPADTPLPDAAQEARARALFTEFRCVVCAGESIADSAAEVAHDLRTAVREMVAAGKDEKEIKQAMVKSYGEFVLMTPAFKPHTYLLWLGPMVIMLVGLAVVFAYFGAVRVEKRK